MSIPAILQNITHRPWPLPNANWKFYQEWNRSLFLHWPVDPDALREVIPAGTELDLYEGKAWISVVAFTMQKIRPKHLPFFKPISNFHEINVRTYITKDHKPGVFFLNIEAQKALSAFLSRHISGMPYEKATILRSLQNNLHTYASVNHKKQFHLHAEYTLSDAPVAKTSLDLFLTERYCAYVPIQQQLFRYNIHHVEWPVQQVAIHKLLLEYKTGNTLLTTDTPPALSHYSEGVQVVTWDKEPA